MQANYPHLPRTSCVAATANLRFTHGLRILASALLVLLLSCSQATAQKAVVLVRHAEKVDESKDAPLSKAGLERAERLAQKLRSLGLTAIFVSEFQRTQQTAAPTAQFLHLQPQVIAAAQRSFLVQRLRSLPAQAIALVVGHSDTLPLLIKDLGVASPPSIGREDYDYLFVVLPSAAGQPPSATLLPLRQ